MFLDPGLNLPGLGLLGLGLTGLGLITASTHGRGQCSWIPDLVFQDLIFPDLVFPDSVVVPLPAKVCLLLISCEMLTCGCIKMRRIRKFLFKVHFSLLFLLFSLSLSEILKMIILSFFFFEI